MNMVALKLIAGVILASIFLATFAALYQTYLSGRAKIEFKRATEQLAETARALLVQDEGAQVFFELEVPENCELRFENTLIIAIAGEEKLTYKLGAPVTGPTLKNQRAKLILKRTGEGVEVIG
jgi:hypothetical protein